MPLRNRGVLPQAEIRNHARIANDPVVRNAGDPDILPVLSNDEYRQLREDLDRKNREEFEKEHGQDLIELGNTFSISDSTADEEAEQYLQTFPDLAEQLFQALDTTEIDQEFGERVRNADAKNLNKTFNEMAHLLQTDNICLDQRISVLDKEYGQFQDDLLRLKRHVQTSIQGFREFLDDFSSDYVIPVEYRLRRMIIELESLTEEFEIYCWATGSTARKLGRLERQKQVYKMINVMILYVRVLRTVRDIRERKVDRLRKDFERAKQLLLENNVECIPTSWRVPRNVGDCMEDAGSRRVSESKGVIVTAPEIMPNFARRGWWKVKDVVRRECFWPWNKERTRKGLSKLLSIFLVIIGIWVMGVYYID